MIWKASTWAVVFALFSTAATAEPPPLDGPKAIFQDALLENMVGNWDLTGTAMKRPAHHTLEVKWILNHQFLQVHELSATNAAGQLEYEALPTIGYDNASERYVAHWLDVYGGRFSETLGYGRRNGNQINFVFEYPDGPFHTDFVWVPEKKEWEWHLSQKDANGKWAPFADFVLKRQ